MSSASSASSTDSSSYLGTGSDLEDRPLPDSYTKGLETLSMPTKRVLIKLKNGETVAVHPEVLIKNSIQFQTDLGLESSFWAEKDPIVLSDLSHSEFGLYFSIAYRVARHDPNNSELRQLWPIDEPGLLSYHSWPEILLLWKLAHRFRNQPVKKVAEDELEGKLSEFSASNWQKTCTTQPKSTYTRKLMRLREAWRICRDDRIPFERSFIRAAGNVPPLVLAQCADDLARKEDDLAELFVVEVTKAFAMRIHELQTADPGAVAQNLPEPPRVRERETDNQNNRQGNQE